MRSGESTQNSQVTEQSHPRWQGGDEDKLGRWKRPYWDSRDGGGWITHLRGPLLSWGVAVGLLDTVTARTEAELRRRMKEQDDRVARYLKNTDDIPTEW